MLGEHCITPDFILCRASVPLDDVRKKKIQEFAYLPLSRILSVPDVSCVYEMPIALEAQLLGDNILAHFNLTSRRIPDWNAWLKQLGHLKKPTKRVHVAIVGKYLDTGDFSLTDSYVSICHALIHAGAYAATHIDIAWIDAKTYEKEPQRIEELSAYDGVIVPGGFGSEGVEGKIAAIAYARTRKIPYLGLCYGMQLAAVEFARNVCNLKNAHTTEVNAKTPHPVIDILPLQKALLENQCYGASMRLGNYSARLCANSKVRTLYAQAGKLHERDNDAYAVERHRHRYEVNPEYVDLLQQAGLSFSGFYTREDGTQLAEYIELKDHPFFIATQAHPEFTSRFGKPNPLFEAFVAACSIQACIRKRPSVYESQGAEISL
jgi:CTP synthase